MAFNDLKLLEQIYHLKYHFFLFLQWTRIISIEQSPFLNRYRFLTNESSHLLLFFQKERTRRYRRSVFRLRFNKRTKEFYNKKKTRRDSKTDPTNNARPALFLIRDIIFSRRIYWRRELKCILFLRPYQQEFHTTTSEQWVTYGWDFTN